MTMKDLLSPALLTTLGSLVVAYLTIRGTRNTDKTNAEITYTKEVATIFDEYRIQLDAYKSQTEAYKSQMEAYKVQLEFYQKQAEAFKGEAENFKAEVEKLKQENIKLSGLLTKHKEEKQDEKN
ncbi:hypothetical protein [Paenilisteria newyorkensis]|uniref:hypothetical protein n=1 Tax=Listeria newyorkensis TaxID=1497681 RepID=UPI000669F96E|nr:hypothetical protein [Listeria newyorkensis]KMT58887.1 hypothetical protein X559_2893 [Listeria newyorkensis]